MYGIRCRRTGSLYSNAIPLGWNECGFSWRPTLKAFHFSRNATEQSVHVSMHIIFRAKYQWFASDQFTFLSCRVCSANNKSNMINYFWKFITLKFFRNIRNEKQSNLLLELSLRICIPISKVSNFIATRNHTLDYVLSTNINYVQHRKSSLLTKISLCRYNIFTKSHNIWFVLKVTNLYKFFVFYINLI